MGMRGTGGTAKAVVVAPLLAALLLTSAACADEESAAPQPLSDSTSPTPTPSETATASESPSPTPTVKPLSRFEDEELVQVGRRWARLYAKSINRGQRGFETAEPLLAGQDAIVNMQQIGREDFGLYFPGPLPFTPTGVERDGRQGRVVGCFWLNGFALEDEGGIPASGREIGAGQIFLEKQGKRWKVVTLAPHDHSCENVPVKGIGW